MPGFDGYSEVPHRLVVGSGGRRIAVRPHRHGNRRVRSHHRRPRWESGRHGNFGRPGPFRRFGRVGPQSDGSGRGVVVGDGDGSPGDGVTGQGSGHAQRLGTFRQVVVDDRQIEPGRPAPLPGRNGHPQAGHALVIGPFRSGIRSRPDRHRNRQVPSRHRRTFRESGGDRHPGGPAPFGYLGLIDGQNDAGGGHVGVGDGHRRPGDRRSGQRPAYRHRLRPFPGYVVGRARQVEPARTAGLSRRDGDREVVHRRVIHSGGRPVPFRPHRHRHRRVRVRQGRLAAPAHSEQGRLVGDGFPVAHPWGPVAPPVSDQGGGDRHRRRRIAFGDAVRRGAQFHRPAASAQVGVVAGSRVQPNNVQGPVGPVGDGAQMGGQAAGQVVAAQPQPEQGGSGIPDRRPRAGRVARLRNPFHPQAGNRGPQPGGDGTGQHVVVQIEFFQSGQGGEDGGDGAAQVVAVQPQPPQFAQPAQPFGYLPGQFVVVQPQPPQMAQSPVTGGDVPH